MSTAKKQLPNLSKMTEQELAEFWDTHSFAEYWDQFERVREPVFVRPTKKVVSLRLDAKTLDLLVMIAREKGIAYTTLLRMWVKERLHEELRKQKEQVTHK